MIFDSSTPGEVKVSMDDYVDKVLLKKLSKQLQDQQGVTSSKSEMKKKRRYFQRSKAICTIMLLYSSYLQHFMYDEIFRLLSYSS